MTDQNTTYSGANFALSNQSCPSGQFATGVNGSGGLSCGAPPSGGGSLASYEGSAGSPLGEDQVNKAADGANPVVSVTPGVAGTYFIVADGVFENQANALIGDNSRTLWCWLMANGQRDEIAIKLAGGFWDTQAMVQGVATVSASDTASMNCYVSGDPSTVRAYRLKIDALKIG